MQTEKISNKALVAVYCEKFLCANWKDGHCILSEITINLKGQCRGVTPIVPASQKEKGGEGSYPK